MTTELSTIDKYAILKHDPEQISEMISNAAGGQGMNFNDLERITIPTGGNTHWQVSSLEGDDQSVEAIVGVIIICQDSRVFWKKEMGGETSPPDCASNDLITGVGDPGGECAVCPNAEYGSKTQGRGQACKVRRNLFMFGEDSVIPFVLQLPITSAQICRKYLFKLAGKAVPMFGCITKVTLERQKTSSGISYSVAKFKAASYLEKKIRDDFKIIATRLGSMIVREPVSGAVTDDGN